MPVTPPKRFRYQNAKRGDFTVKVSGTTGISSGQWVQLRLRSGDGELVKKEIGPIALNENWAIAKAPISIAKTDDLYGVKITEFHQVKSASNGKITFYEPIMHDIDIKNITIRKGGKSVRTNIWRMCRCGRPELRRKTHWTATPITEKDTPNRLK